ncbi:MAG TPA: DUF6036 family nucleotidyltransferase [Fimbriimonadaceae bacterium]|jgi:hypothetical protein
MRSPVDSTKIIAFMEEVGRLATGPGRIYLVGGSTVALLGIRAQTVDIDLKLEPEPKGIFEAIAKIKNTLDINVELASPDDFIPAIPGWQERSQFIGRYGQVDFFHYDFYGQALAKISRGHGRDLSDVKELVAGGMIKAEMLPTYFEQIKPDLIRYPAIDGKKFERNLTAFIQGLN